MRTTVTLDPDVADLVKRVMEERGVTFKKALNDAIRDGLTPAARKSALFRTPTFAMGFNPAIPWDKSLRLAGVLEDDEVAHRLASRK
ncbi:MAG: antitoxin [Actinobacteria bacterium]|jgi:transcriptional regulator of nitric oxide reductase|nr:antitoxin [Actinomycetota bacterium]